MPIDKKFIDLFHNISAKAALASYHYVGKKDKIAADKAAVDSMRENLNKISMKGQIVIGEGELDDAPMLYTGEKLGTGNGPELDIAVDPLEGTNFAANNLPGALSVIAVSEKKKLFNAPETYMDKIAIFSSKKDIVDLDILKSSFRLDEGEEGFYKLSLYQKNVIGTDTINETYNRPPIGPIREGLYCSYCGSMGPQDHLMDCDLPEDDSLYLTFNSFDEFCSRARELGKMPSSQPGK